MARMTPVPAEPPLPISFAANSIQAPLAPPNAALFTLPFLM